jgi:hypothetical protein
MGFHTKNPNLSDISLTVLQGRHSVVMSRWSQATIGQLKRCGHWYLAVPSPLHMLYNTGRLPGCAHAV